VLPDKPISISIQVSLPGTRDKDAWLKTMAEFRAHLDASATFQISTHPSRESELRLNARLSTAQFKVLLVTLQSFQ